MSASVDAGTELPEILEGVFLAPFTSLGLGGPARWFAQAARPAQLMALLDQARRLERPHYLLGGGTNVLISDRGFSGLVIRYTEGSIAARGARLVAGAGADLSLVVERGAELGLSGLEPLCGIPGTVGGAIRGNAGAFGRSIGDLVRNVTLLQADTGEVLTHDRGGCSFGYRSSIFKGDPRLIVLSAELELTEGDRDRIRCSMAETLQRRGADWAGERSAGSFFMNVCSGDPALIRLFEEDRRCLCRNCTIPAGWLIDRAGLRGVRIGGAQVSERHANVLINTGTASAADMFALACLIKSRVRETLNVELQEEVTLVGF